MGISPCPNDIFIFAGILLGAVRADGLSFQVQFEDVETLNQRTQRGELDIAKISYANFIRCRGKYDLLHSGGALGRGVGPLLLSNEAPFDPEREVLSPGEFTTANFLLDFYLGRKVRKRYLPFDALYAELLANRGAQGVVIHEKRFTYERDGLTLIQDLGEHWERKTGYAIPLGAIVCRKEIKDAFKVDNLIESSLAWSYEHHAEAFQLCREHAQDLSPEVVQAHIDLYVNEFSMNLGREGREAVDFFLARQQELLS